MITKTALGRPASNNESTAGITQSGFPDALTLCCALASQVTLLSPILGKREADAVIARARQEYPTRDRVLRWRDDKTPQACAERWARARQVVCAFYADAHGIDQLPADHTKAELPEPAVPC